MAYYKNVLSNTIIDILVIYNVRTICTYYNI